MVKERIFKKQYAQELLNIACNDLIAARSLASDVAVRRETVLFQLQQSTEKALKALICHLGLAVPMTHDIGRLIDRVPADQQPSNIEDLVDLSDFASIRRYEEGTFEMTPEEVSAAINSVTAAIARIRSILGKQ